MTTAQATATMTLNSNVPQEAVMTSFAQQSATELELSFTDVVEQYWDLAFNVALRMLHNPADAEDAVQEAFISAYRAFPRFKGESKVSTWLYRIVVNACLMKIRKDKNRAKHLTQTGYDDAIVRDWRNDPEDAAVNSELHQVLEKGLGLLSPDLRAAVVLRDVQGLSTEETAESLNLTVASLKSRLHRGRILLRKHLEGYVANARA